MKTITIEELLQLDQNTITVLDVRPADAYTRGSVPGAVSIPLAEVEERMEELPKEKPVYVLCHTGEWSVDAVYELEAAGCGAELWPAAPCVHCLPAGHGRAHHRGQRLL